MILGRQDGQRQEVKGENVHFLLLWLESLRTSDITSTVRQEDNCSNSHLLRDSLVVGGDETETQWDSSWTCLQLLKVSMVLLDHVANGAYAVVCKQADTFRV